MTDYYDVCVVGTGPAGIFAALELGRSHKVLMLEMGRPFADSQFCKVADKNLECDGCENKCNIITGFGGAFCFQNGGLLSLYPAGSFLLNYYDNEKLLLEDYDRAIKIWNTFSNNKLVFSGSTNSQEIIEFGRKVEQVDAKYKHFNGYRLSRENLRKSIFRLQNKISRLVDLKFNSQVVLVTKGKREFWCVRCQDGKKYWARAVLFATGRKGNSIVSKQLEKIGVAYKKTGIDLGVRLEITSKKIDYLSKLHPDIKIKFNVDGEEVRTFCFCPQGRVTHFNQNMLHGKESINFLEGYIDECCPSNRTNLSFLHRINFSSIDEVWNFQRKFEEVHSKQGGKIIAQRFSDIGNCLFRPLPERVTLRDYMIGNISKVIPQRSFIVLLEAIRRFDRLMDGIVLDKETVICGPELGNFWPEIQTDNYFQTNLKGLFVAGDALGFTRGALQGCVTGMKAARGIKKILKEENEFKDNVV